MRFRSVLLPITLACLMPPKATAQAPRPDPLDTRFETIRTALVADPQQGLRASEMLERVAARRDGAQSRLVAASRWLQAEAYVRLGDTANARREINSAMAVLQRMHERLRLEGDVLRTRGDMAADAADVAAALADYQSAYRVYVATSDPRGQALALLSMGALYRQGGDLGSALRYYGQAIDAYDTDPLLVVSLLNNRGNVLADMGRNDRALVDLKGALRVVHSLDNPAFEVQILRNIARVQRALGDRVAAERSIATSLRLAQSIGSQGAVDQLRTLAARLAMDRGDAATATALIDQVFEGIDLRTTPLVMRDNHRNAYAVYAAAGDAPKALAHLEAIERLNEQVAQLTTSTKTALMAARFDFQNQELRIARLKQEELRRKIQFERESARFQRTLTAGITSAATLLVALLIFGVVTLRRSRNAVRRANVDLATTNAALEKALKAKGAFLATTSHEIRTPLNGILGMTQVMLVSTDLAPDMRDRLGIVQNAGLAMRALVDDILDVAKMESGSLGVERIPTDLTATIDDVARLWRRQALDRGLGFQLDIGDVPRWIESDPGRLRQILFNLLSNALKFTRGGSIGLRVAVEGGRLRIAVSDTGIGIAADRLGEVFESFQQADNSTTREFGGTGLGLTICRNLARALGGDILLESHAGRGSTFTVDLPLVEAAPLAASADACADPDRCALAILERNPIARGVMRTLFAEHVPEITFVDDAPALLVRIGQGGVAAALVDVAALRSASTDPAGDLARIDAALRAAGAVGVLTAQAADSVASTTPGMTLLTKPVSGTQLLDALFERTNGRPAEPSALVSHAA
jgi:signal transduction histidine kinase